MKVSDMNGWGTCREGGVRLIQITEGGVRLIQITERPEVHLATSLNHLPVKTHNMSNVNTNLQCFMVIVRPKAF